MSWARGDRGQQAGRSGPVRAARGVLLAALWLALVVWPPLPAVAQEVTPEPLVYVVQPGDTLVSIAARYGTTVEDLAEVNGIANPRLIVVGQKLVIPTAGATPPPEPEPTSPPEAGPRSYVVQPGDTLAAIARRFGTTVQALVVANGIADPALISVGQTLTIPGAGAEPEPVPQPQPVYRRIHRVRLGETLPFLAFRYGTTTWAILGSNELGPLGLLWPGQELEIPRATAPTPASPRFPEIAIKPSTSVQGQTLAVEVESASPLELSGHLLDQELVFTPAEGGAWALLGVDVLTDPGIYTLVLSAVESDTSDRLSINLPVAVAGGSFGRTNVAVPADRQGLLDPALSRAESKKINQVFAQTSGTRLWQGVFSPPLAGEMPVSAGFGQLRSYSGGPVTGYHAGQDVDVDSGTPVYASADGTVVLAEPLQVRGNAIILDHGLGVFTGFWHLSQIDVQPGQAVERGEVVGRVGNTGLSTGAHLHWEMRVRGVPVDPVQWTQQAFP